jgi:hypothetical protein
MQVKIEGVCRSYIARAEQISPRNPQNLKIAYIILAIKFININIAYIILLHYQYIVPIRNLSYQNVLCETSPETTGAATWS